VIAVAAEEAMPLEALSDSSRERPAGSFDDFSPYPPIADYAFLSDCEVTALVAPSGSVEWTCLPKMDGPSIFAAMLDRDAGWFRFGPDDVDVPSDRRYLPGTMVLETSWDCGQGWLVVRECLVMGPWQHDQPHGSTHIRPPTDYDAEHMLLRTVRCVDGQAQLTLDCVRLPAAGVDRAPLAALAGPRPLPGPPLAQPPGPQRAHPQGPDVRADRRDRGRGDYLAARGARPRTRSTPTSARTRSTTAACSASTTTPPPWTRRCC
jgi:Domain of unknown function (DUF5911)